MVICPEPSSRRATSPQTSAAASGRLNPASNNTATKARSNLPRSSACSGYLTPRPRLRDWTTVRRITARTSAVRVPDDAGTFDMAI